MIVHFQERFLVERGQRRSGNIELQMNSGRDFVYILPASPLRPHRMDIDLSIRDGNVLGDVQHIDLGLRDVAFSRERFWHLSLHLAIIGDPK